MPSLQEIARRLRQAAGLITALALLAGCGGSAEPAASSAAAMAERSPDPAVAAAALALARGEGWRATRLVAPALADSARRTPEALHLAASAASRWGGWREVRLLLEGHDWLDTLYHGEGRALLARAALARNDPAGAVLHARAAVAAAADRAVEGERQVVLGQALDRLDHRAEAAEAYLRAADLLPSVADWLRLRAVAVTDSAPARAALLGLLQREIASRLAPDAEAEARERAGDLAAAARLRDSLGEPVAALRLRLAAAADSVVRDSLRDALVQLVRLRPGSGTAAAAVVALDAERPPPAPPATELAIARSLARSGPLDRAAAAFEAAFAAGLGGADDRFAYADVLARAGRHAAAAAAFADVPASARRAPEAAYLQARSLVRAGRVDEGRALLPGVAARHPRDTVAAGTALYLLGDLASDDRDEPGARRLFLELVRRYPSSPHAATARFRAAMIALLAGAADSAAHEFDSVATRRLGDATAARYWAGRAWWAAGDTAAARARWQTIVASDPFSYYALLSARRLGTRLPPLPDGIAPPPSPAADSAIARATLLAALGLVREAGLELDGVVSAAGDSVPLLLAAAEAFRTSGHAGRSIRAAQRAADRGAPRDAQLYRLLYPLTHVSSLLAESAERGLDPALVAALVRQESWFDPAATSRAGARGLMQLMPAVGATLAERAGLPLWDPVLLWHGEVSLQLGTMHLRELSERYDEVGRVLAAYNAGAARVERWSGKVGADDPEVFAERIPFTETRDYVRIIQRSRELYRTLYEWPAPAAPHAATHRSPSGARPGR